MNYQCFFFDKNIFFSQGLKSVIQDACDDSMRVQFSSSNNIHQLVEVLKQQRSEREQRWVICDFESFPQGRFNVLNMIKMYYRHHRQKLVILLSENNIPLFFALHSLLPGAHWLLKSESKKNVNLFFNELKCSEIGQTVFSPSLVSYTRMKWLTADAGCYISSDEWWLMEEIFKGKSLSQIANEVNINVRRLSYYKRRLMKRLNVTSNVALFNVFKCIVATPRND